MYIQRLIQEYCPNGVEYKALGEVCKRQKGIAITAGEMKKLDKPNGVIRIFAAGNTVANVNYGDIQESGIIKKPSIIVKSRGNIGFEYYEKPFSHKNEMWSYSSNINIINLKFVYYYLQNHIDEFQKKAKTGKLPQIATGDTDKFRIPVPHIEVQREIVRILDNFTEYTEELKNTLLEELILRKKQYEYYQEKLITEQKNVEHLKICDVCNLSVGGDVPKERFSKEPTSQYSVPIYSNGVGESALYGYTDLPKIKEPCVTIAARGTIGYCEYRDEPFYPIIRLICAVPKKAVIAKYLKYVIRLIKFQVPETGIPQLTIPMLSRYTIPVPSLQEQERIVAILDKFDALCNDLTQGLPAEIEARKKQYEYYRDKLLTFKEKTA